MQIQVQNFKSFLYLLVLLVFTCPLVLHGHSVDLEGELPVNVILAVETGSAIFLVAAG
jgi:hypothetical protein